MAISAKNIHISNLVCPPEGGRECGGEAPLPVRLSVNSCGRRSLVAYGFMRRRRERNGKRKQGSWGVNWGGSSTPEIFQTHNQDS